MKLAITLEPRIQDVEHKLSISETTWQRIEEYKKLAEKVHGFETTHNEVIGKLLELAMNRDRNFVRHERELREELARLEKEAEELKELEAEIAEEEKSEPAFEQTGS